jgi:hypothetical protein
MNECFLNVRAGREEKTQRLQQVGFLGGRSKMEIGGQEM